ncbi:MAG TPA: alanine--tRNA ligase, partial [Cellvibrionales bacterium]|nr:alanine--tRNA ligase [Cellvibrionales bacterium]
VTDTQKQASNAFEHHGIQAKGALQVGDAVEASIDQDRRKKIMNNHSATHLLHEALRQVLGDQVNQKGSLVESEKLRFDFSHDEVVSRTNLDKVEAIVNEQILGNTQVITEETDIKTAKKKGAMALFGEKYGDSVRVLSMGDDNFSVELCGGTHAKRTGDIGLMLIVSESGIASGVRRIEAVSGAEALKLIDATDAKIQQASQLLKTNPADMTTKVQQMLEQQKALEKKLQQLQQKLASSVGSDLAEQAMNVNGVKVLAAVLEGADPKSLRDTVDQLKQKIGSGVVILAAPTDEKIALVAGVTDSLVERVRAGDIIKSLSAAVGGKGGGRADFAQGGGVDHGALAAAIEQAKLDVIAKL